MTCVICSHNLTDSHSFLHFSSQLFITIHHMSQITTHDRVIVIQPYFNYCCNSYIIWIKCSLYNTSFGHPQLRVHNTSNIWQQITMSGPWNPSYFMHHYSPCIAIFQEVQRICKWLFCRKEDTDSCIIKSLWDHFCMIVHPHDSENSQYSREVGGMISCF